MHFLHLLAWKASEDVLFLGLILLFQKVPKRQKQTGVVGKADIVENKTSQGSGESLVYVPCSTWGLLDPWNFP